MKQKLRATPPVMFILKDVNHLEHDPRSQYRFNRFWALLWGLGIITIPFFPTLYAHTISALIIQEISLWANFATHFGAMSAALAAGNAASSAKDVDAIAELTERMDEISSLQTTTPDTTID
jgi:hypothetical protein